MVPCKSNAEEVSFEWSHQRILSTYSKVRTTLDPMFHIIDSGSEWVKAEIVLFPSQTVHIDEMSQSALFCFAKEGSLCLKIRISKTSSKLKCYTYFVTAQVNCKFPHLANRDFPNIEVLL